MPRTLYRDAALADGTGPQLKVGVSLLVADDRIEWIRPSDDEPDPGPGTEVVDASGCTIVPGLVDSHSHLTLPGGAHWIDRGFDPADRLLQAFKYAGMLALAEPLAEALADALATRDARRPDVVIAVPLSQRRQRERGFNHAHEIARRLAMRLQLPLGHALARTRDAPPQAGLTLRERARNLHDAFEASRSVSGRAVAIVDDVMTTGATLRAASRALRAAGAARIDAWVVARTPAR